jgi:hypothetical protein
VIATVFTASVDFGGDLPDDAWVEVEDEQGRAVQRRVPLGGEDPHEVVLLGLAPVSTYTAHVVASRGGERADGRPQELTTGQVPPEMPDFFVQLDEGREFDGLLFTSIAGEPSGPVAVDTAGRVVWWYVPEEGVGVARAAMTRDGTAVLFANINVTGGQGNKLWRVSLDGTEASSIRTPYIHHDFTELPNGTIAYLAYDPRTIQGVSVLGDRIMEALPEGGNREAFNIWNVDDVLPYHREDSLPRGMWPHANALQYLEDEDAYLVSFLCLGAIVKIDRESGDLVWILGGDASSFALPDGGTDLLEGSHQFEPDGDDLLVFVNGAQSGGDSRIEGFTLDVRAGVATPSWSYWPDPSLHAPTLGDVHRLEGGHVLANFGYAGQVHEVEDDGTPVWILSASVGGALGYTSLMESLYPRSW